MLLLMATLVQLHGAFVCEFIYKKCFLFIAFFLVTNCIDLETVKVIRVFFQIFSVYLKLECICNF